MERKNSDESFGKLIGKNRVEISDGAIVRWYDPAGESEPMMYTAHSLGREDMLLLTSYCGSELEVSPSECEVIGDEIGDLMGGTWTMSDIEGFLSELYGHKYRNYDSGIDDAVIVDGGTEYIMYESYDCATYHRDECPRVTVYYAESTGEMTDYRVIGWR